MNLPATLAWDDLNEVEQFQLGGLGVEINERRSARRVGRLGGAAVARSELVPVGQLVCVEFLPGRVDDPAERNLRRSNRAVRVAGKSRTRLGLRRAEPPRSF